MNAKQLVVGNCMAWICSVDDSQFLLRAARALALPYDRLASIGGVTVDLFIALALVSIWDVLRRGGKRGKSAIPLILMALVFGSLGTAGPTFFYDSATRAPEETNFSEVEHRPLEAK